MVSIESLRDQFDELGVDPSPEVVNKCIEICTRYDIEDAVEFVETWMAYSVSKLGGAEPTVDNLRDMESHEFANRGRKTAGPATNRVKQREDFGSPRSPPEDGSEAGLVIYSNANLDSVESDVLGSYGCVTPKAQKPVSRLHGSTPDRSKVLFSPASYSPITSKRSQDQDGPNNSGNVVYTFGNGQLLKQVNWSTTDVDRRNPLSIKYMFDSSYERILILGDRIYEGGKRICRRLASLRQEERADLPEKLDKTECDELTAHKNEQDEILEKVGIRHVDHPCTEPVNIMGRIVVHPEKKQDRVAIVDFDELTLRQMKLDFSKMKTWSVFPGETVVMEGVNPRGNVFEVHNIYYEIDLELPKAPMKLGNEVNMVIASGPYTDKDDLLYEKLSDLLTYCKNNCPDVLILTGPFGDISNPLFGTIAETYEEYFEKIIINIMSSVSPNTEVLIVSHHDDLMSMFVFPSFPYTISTSFPNLRFLPDPCIISINGLEIGITTADIIKDLSEAEVSGDPKGDKIKRAFNYMFHHKTFYPLNPPPENLPLDMDLLSTFGKLSRVPNMMICPGDLKCYIRDVHRCVCINPGRLSDQTSGEGTFARVVIKQPESEAALPFNYVVCQVVKS
ncbi:AAEL007692-PA [Aedes aegypti]|uniref:DNA polymerase alpha subunit B n=1 Tax=Aedes aegypti TaxID=7159 RepID=Q171D3_AEDAE|nr:AAEL007692-PA [Aedes aegypti]